MPLALRSLGGAFRARRLAALAALAPLAAACDRTPATAPDAGPAASRAPDRRGGGLPDRYVLPGDAVFPEGIAYDERTGTVYVTSTADGTVFRGDVRDDTLAVFLPGRADGRTTAVGVAVDPRRQRLFVAGGETGRVFVYDTRTGALLASLAGGAAPTFVNDVAVAPDGAAYVTDSRSPFIYRVVEEGGAFRLERWLDLTGTAVVYRTGFNLNGIEVAPGGRYLFTVQSNTGQLFRVDTRTRAVARVDLGGDGLPNGDGLFLRGATLYAVQNRDGVIAEVRLRGFGPGAPSGRVVGRTGDPSFRFPTTLEEARGRLLVVNAQFDRRGPGLAPDLPFTVSVVRAPGG
jgi:Cu-Zn family superoxide dismutase